jgi:hypothetical protein
VGHYLRVRLEGEDAQLGHIAATDFARLLIGTQSAVQRAAASIIGQSPRDSGRPGKTVEEGTRLRLAGIERGSVIAVLEPPARGPDSHQLDLADRTLGENAIARALDVLGGREEDFPEVAEAFLRVAEDVGIGRRYRAVSYEPSAPELGAAARIDTTSIEQLRRTAARSPAATPDTVTGMLFEADFERNTAQLRGVGGERVQVRFPAELADEIQAALREPARLRGDVEYDPHRSEARAVQLRTIVRGEQLVLGLDPGDFRTAQSIEEVALRRGMSAVVDLTVLRDPEATDDEIERMLAAVE